MTRRNLSVRRIVGCVVATSAFLSGIGARGAAINTGVEQILWPAVILASPFFIVRGLLFGSDKEARASAEKEALKVLDAQQEPLLTNGLYVGSIDLRYALYGMMAESKLPLVELNTAGSAWLLSQAKEPGPLAEQATAHKFIQITLEDRGDPNCFQWKDSSGDWAARPPVQPTSCIAVRFSDQLMSSLQLSVNTKRLSHRELRWELIDRASDKVLLSVPYWTTQSEGQPLNVDATYRARHETYTFVEVIKKLTPRKVAVDDEGRPRVLNWLEETNRRENLIEPVKILGQVRAPELNWSDATRTERNLTWEQGYALAAASGKPVLMNERFLIDVQRNRTGRVCAIPALIQCEFAKNSLHDVGVISTNYLAAYQPQGPAPAYTVDMAVLAANRSHDGQLLWYARIVPSNFPEPVRMCSEAGRSCYFFPKDTRISNGDLIVRGVFQATGGGLWPDKQELPRDDYELVVPLSAIPQVSFATRN